MKKKLAISVREKVALIDRGHRTISLSRQADLLGLARSSISYCPHVNEEEVRGMHLIDEIYTEAPFYGSRKLKAALARQGAEVGRARVQKLMRAMGIEAIDPKPKGSQRHPEHRGYPYLLRGLKITRPNQVWATDITYIRLVRGWMYLVAILDWFSRYVVSWGGIDHAGCGVLSGSVRGRFPRGNTRDVQE